MGYRRPSARQHELRSSDGLNSETRKLCSHRHQPVLNVQGSQYTCRMSDSDTENDRTIAEAANRDGDEEQAASQILAKHI